MTSNEGTVGANADQAAYWNSPAGLKWVENEALLDEELSGVLERLLQLAAPRPGEAALDVGCGTGASTLALAAAVSPGGRVVGADISEFHVARARERAAGIGGVELVLADAQTHAFGPAGFDLAVSRFGVMFFADPVAAFANILGAMRPGGRLVFAAWAPMEANPWFTIPKAAAVARLGPLPPDPPGAAGPFGLADTTRGLDIMRRADFADGRVRTETVGLALAGGVPAAARLATSLGPAVRLLREKNGTSEDAAAIAEAVAEGFAPYADGSGIRVPALIHFYEAERPA